MAGTDTAIPTRSRDLVRGREGGLCLRCTAPGNQWHHRRPRSVTMGHYRHCTCNGVLLCTTCHTWAHQWPRAATAAGLIVSRNEPFPGVVPVRGLWGWFALDCAGAAQGLSLENVVTAGLAPRVVASGR